MLDRSAPGLRGTTEAAQADPHHHSEPVAAGTPEVTDLGRVLSAHLTAAARGRVDGTKPPRAVAAWRCDELERGDTSGRGGASSMYVAILNRNESRPTHRRPWRAD